MKNECFSWYFPCFFSVLFNTMYCLYVCFSLTCCLCIIGVALSFVFLDPCGWNTCLLLPHQAAGVYQPRLSTKSLPARLVIYTGNFLLPASLLALLDHPATLPTRRCRFISTLTAIFASGSSSIPK